MAVQLDSQLGNDPSPHLEKTILGSENPYARFDLPNGHCVAYNTSNPGTEQSYIALNPVFDASGKVIGSDILVTEGLSGAYQEMYRDFYNSDLIPFDKEHRADFDKPAFIESLKGYIEKKSDQPYEVLEFDIIIYLNQGLDERKENAREKRAQKGELLDHLQISLKVPFTDVEIKEFCNQVWKYVEHQDFKSLNFRRTFKCDKGSQAANLFAEALGTNTSFNSVLAETQQAFAANHIDYEGCYFGHVRISGNILEVDHGGSPILVIGKDGDVKYPPNYNHKGNSSLDHSERKLESNAYGTYGEGLYQRSRRSLSQNISITLEDGDAVIMLGHDLEDLLSQQELLAGLCVKEANQAIENLLSAYRVKTDLNSPVAIYIHGKDNDRIGAEYTERVVDDTVIMPPVVIQASRTRRSFVPLGIAGLLASAGLGVLANHDFGDRSSNIEGIVQSISPADLQSEYVKLMMQNHMTKENIESWIMKARQTLKRDDIPNDDRVMLTFYIKTMEKRLAE